MELYHWACEGLVAHHWGIVVLALSAWLRSLSSSPDPVLFGQLQFTSGIVAITFAGAALVRFRGTQDRLPLILAAGFVIVGVTLASSSLSLAALPLLNQLRVFAIL